MPEGTETPTPPEGAEATPAPKWYKRIPWKKIGKIGIPIAIVIVAVVAVLGLFKPSEAKDPTARANLVTETTARTTGDNTLRTDMETKLGEKASLTDLSALQQETERRAGVLQAAIDLRPTKTDVDLQVGTEAQARTAADDALRTDLGARIDGVAATVNGSPDAPGLSQQVQAIQTQLAPPQLPADPAAVGTYVRHPVR